MYLCKWIPNEFYINFSRHLEWWPFHTRNRQIIWKEMSPGSLCRLIWIEIGPLAAFDKHSRKERRTKSDHSLFVLEDLSVRSTCSFHCVKGLMTNFAEVCFKYPAIWLCPGQILDNFIPGYLRLISTQRNFASGQKFCCLSWKESYGWATFYCVKFCSLAK